MATLPVVRQQESVRDLTWLVAGLAERTSAAILFALLAPATLVCGLMIAGISRRTPFIAHRRVGWQGADLWVIKLRTMWEPGAKSRRDWRWIESIDGPSGPELKRADDPRVPNALARFLRRHSVDEIPQFWHVVCGQMSLVGPRPMTDGELRDFYGSDVDEILRAKPGMVGLWQVSGRNKLSYAERRALDLKLVRDRSFRMCAEILLRTVGEVWNGANSW